MKYGLLLVLLVVFGGGLFWFLAAGNDDLDAAFSLSDSPSKAASQDRKVNNSITSDDSESESSSSESSDRNSLESGGVARIEDFITLIDGGWFDATDALSRIRTNWHPGSRVMLFEAMRFNRDPGLLPNVIKLLEDKMGVNFASNQNRWFQEVWDDEYKPHPDYGDFKARLYERIDPRFAEYFSNERKSLIRLDEIRWGGVLRDGIPPLKDPEVTTAMQADYLAETDVVFGVVVNGKARAYPKRILAWHEMVKDHVGGVSINGVYCTLCGSMIVYFTETEGPEGNNQHFELGTSGFLYRSNKLMYDHATKSMWSTLQGKPVVGPLVGKGIQLKPHYVVTSTWGEWKNRYPDSEVLTLNTGYQKDYREGAAYRDYFATDRLMFAVPKLDQRLMNKDQVFVLRDQRFNSKPIVISEEFLRNHPLYYQELDTTGALVITDASGANRAYDVGQMKFRAGEAAEELLDEEGKAWTVSAAKISSSTGESFPRMPAHRAFWFGWYSAHPDTELIH